jgi:hypothetical protein
MTSFRMTHGLKAGKTNHMGESKAKQINRLAQDPGSFSEVTIFRQKTHKYRQG